MSYKNDGSVHYGGIQNEKEMCVFLTEIDHYGCELVHRGGTKQVQDADTKNGDEATIKKWEGATHDWYNSSPLAREVGLSDRIQPFIKKFKKEIANIPADEHYAYRKEQEEKLREFIADSLDELCTDAFADKFVREFINHSKDMDVIINEIKEKKVHIYKFDQHPAVVYYNKGYKPVIISKSGKKKCSRNIFMVKDGDKVDIGLRVRFVTNNGLKPFTKEGSTNKSTTATIKLQQDNVKNILSKVTKVCYPVVDETNVYPDW